jgi:hypothetical protein
VRHDPLDISANTHYESITAYGAEDSGGGRTRAIRRAASDGQARRLLQFPDSLYRFLPRPSGPSDSYLRGAVAS